MRDWLAVYLDLPRKPKYRRLTIPARAALFHVWILAGGQSPEATWGSRDELADVLDLDGYPPDVLDELIARRWLDVDDGGRVLVHDWDEHQLAATEAARRAYERDRKRDWRRSRPTASPSLPAPSLPVQDRTSHHITESPGTVRDTSGTRGDPNAWGEAWHPFLEEWVTRYRYLPSDDQRATLWPIIDARPNDAASWLRKAPPGVEAFGAVGHVLKRWNALRERAA